METALLVVAACLALGGIGAATVTTRPRPSGWLEIVWLAIPPIAILVLVVVTAGRL